MDKIYKELFEKYLNSQKSFIATYYDSMFEVIDTNHNKIEVKHYEYNGKVYDVCVKYKGLDLFVRINPLDIVIYLMDLIEEKK